MLTMSSIFLHFTHGGRDYLVLSNAFDIFSMSAKLEWAFSQAKKLIKEERNWLGVETDGMLMPETVAGKRCYNVEKRID